MTAPIDVLAALTLEDGRPWGEAATELQLADARAVLAIEAEWRRFWNGRSRGWSKTTDGAGYSIAAGLGGLIPEGERGYFVAADKDQARLTIDAARGLVTRSGLSGVVECDTYRLRFPETDVVVEAISSDSASAWGLRGHFWIVDELTAWRDTPEARRFWEAVSTAWPKVPTARVVVIATAGSPSHFSHKLYGAAVDDPAWRVSEVRGPAPWLDPAEIEAERSRLPESAFRRLWLNEWTEHEGVLVVGENLVACQRLVEWPCEFEVGLRPYVVAVDLGLRSDRTVVSVMHAERDVDSDRTLVALDRMLRWSGSRREPVALSEVEAAIVRCWEDYGHPTVVLDPWNGALLRERLGVRGVRVVEHVFTPASNGRMALALHQRLRDGSLLLPRAELDEVLDDELRSVELRETGPGQFRLDHVDGKHDDQVVTLGMGALWLADRVGRRGRARTDSGVVAGSRLPTVGIGSGRGGVPEIRFSDGSTMDPRQHRLARKIDKWRRGSR